MEEQKKSFKEIYYGMNNFSISVLAFGIELSIMLFLLAMVFFYTASGFPRPMEIYDFALSLTDCAISIITISVIFGLLSDIVLQYDKPKEDT